MSPRTVPTVKNRLRQLTASQLRELTAKCRTMETAEQVGECLRHFLDTQLEAAELAAVERDSASPDNPADGRLTAAPAADHEMLA